MTDETKTPEETRPPAPEPTTPEEVEAYFARVEDFFGKTLMEKLQEVMDSMIEKRNILFYLYVTLLRGSLGSLKHHIEDPEVQDVSWENPWTELHYPVEWNWEDMDLVHLRPEDSSEEALAPITDALKRGEDPLKVAPDAVKRLGLAMLSASIMERHVLLGLTHSLAVHVKGGEEAGYFFLDPKVKTDLDALPTEEERAVRWEEITKPFSIGAFEEDEATLFPMDTPWEETTPLLVVSPEDHDPSTAREWTEIEKEAKDLPTMTFGGEVNGTPFRGSVVIMFHPLVVDEDKREAFFPIVTGLVIIPDTSGVTVDPSLSEDEASAKAIAEMAHLESLVNPETWPEEDRADLWKSLLIDLPKKLLVDLGVSKEEADKEISAAGIPGGDTPAPETAAPETTPTVTPAPEEAPQVLIAGSTQLTAALVLAGSPSPERLKEAKRRSKMPPVSVPRGTGEETQGLALLRGLGKLFSGYEKVQDLGLDGTAATDEAERLFFVFFEAALDRLQREGALSWSKRTKRPRTIYTLSGLGKAQASKLWDEIAKAAGGKEGGAPSVKVSTPELRSENRIDFEKGGALLETELVFWPDEAPRDPYGWPEPRVRFKGWRSPGYQALLGKRKEKPFFADNFVWFLRGGELEGVRAGGLAHLLYPEGRAALEDMKTREKERYEEELQRIFRDPSLFRGQDARLARDLQAAIRGAQAFIKRLSTYDCQDLVRCIFEDFAHQRDAWAREVVTLKDGREITTRPWRVLRLDPEGLRLRLDPRGTWGDNWRGRLFEKLEALTTFERQTRDLKSGRKVDVGDRFLLRAMDGRRGVKDGPEADSAVGLTKLLETAKAFPVDAFFVEVSLDFMGRLVTWAQDEKGKVFWGLDAAAAAKRAALSNGKADPKAVYEEVRDKARKTPYAVHSPRLLTLANWDSWPTCRKFLAYQILEEVTPCFEWYRDTKGRRRKRRLKNHLGGKEALIIVGGKDYLSCNGSSGNGYTVKAWIKKGGYEKRTGPRGGAQAFADFVEDLRALGKGVRLWVKVSGPGPDGKLWHTQGDEALFTLESAKRNPPQAYTWKVLTYLPQRYEKDLYDRLLELGIDTPDQDEETTGPAPPEELPPHRIKAALAAAGWTQEELAAKVKVSRPVLTQWLNGKRPVPEARKRQLRDLLKEYLPTYP